MASENGLTDAEAKALLKTFGKNEFSHSHIPESLRMVWGIVREPMFLLLMVACLIYFLLQEYVEAYTMLIAILLVSGISYFQETRSRKAIKSLRQLNDPGVKVIRNGREKMIPTIDLVPGDLLVLEEGNRVPADALILQANDLEVNESVLSGESMPVEKKVNQSLFQGTLITRGYCTARVTATGNHTRLNRLGKMIYETEETKSTLQQQVSDFTRKLATAGIVIFMLVFLINYTKTANPIESLLYSLVLAMSIIPEEIPVTLSSFMALGAYRMGKIGIIAKRPQTMESLGKVNTICLDKTGTITENRMKVVALYVPATHEILHSNNFHRGKEVLYYAFLASESSPYDSMEKAIHEAALPLFPSENGWQERFIHEYPLSGKPPMMTHVYTAPSSYIVAGKGAPERIMQVCKLPTELQKEIHTKIQEMAAQGWRVLGVCKASLEKDEPFPEQQDNFQWTFVGLLALSDPPRENIQEVIRQFYGAGIEVKILTGDFTDTAKYIASSIGLKHAEICITGNEVMQMSETRLRQMVQEVNLFARMDPEAKLQVIEAIKATGKIVAMTGDGVNDGPALKAADIGIAMGKKGADMARETADLIITDDHLEKILIAIAHGKRIYENIKKAIRYILSIHIPIILTVFIPILFDWSIINIFTPVHIIFLELLMSPTSSIFFENEPAEPGLMMHASNPHPKHFFKRNELLISIIQGLFITAGSLFIYYMEIKSGYTIEKIRTHVFLYLIFCNLFLTFSNRSFNLPISKSLRLPNRLIWIVLFIHLTCINLLLFSKLFMDIFAIDHISPTSILLIIVLSVVCVGWIEIFKWRKSIIKFDS